MITIFVALPDGLLTLRRQGDRWLVERPLDGLPTQCIAADPRRPERLYCGTFGRGLWRSGDGGTNWQPLGRVFRSSQVMAVAVSAVEHAGDVGVVYAGTEATALYRSDDGGDTWREMDALLALPSAPSWSFPPRPYTSHVRAIACDPNVPGRLYVAVEAGALVTSDDGGTTWTDRVPGGPFDSHTLVTPASVPGLISSAAGDGYFESRDAARTWARLDEELPYRYCWGLATDPANPETLLLSAAPGPYHAHNAEGARSGVFRKVAGEPWRQVRDGLPPEDGTLASALAASPAEPDVFYAANNTGLYHSRDGGQTWERLDIPWPERARGQRPEALLVVDLP
ncbi:MAG TPA: glycosyl hydrolase [Ktedonobacterales bacterium]